MAAAEEASCSAQHQGAVGCDPYNGVGKRAVNRPNSLKSLQAGDTEQTRSSLETTWPQSPHTHTQFDNMTSSNDLQVISEYYEQIHTKRLCELVGLWLRVSLVSLVSAGPERRAKHQVWEIRRLKRSSQSWCVPSQWHPGSQLETLDVPKREKYGKLERAGNQAHNIFPKL